MEECQSNILRARRKILDWRDFAWINYIFFIIFVLPAKVFWPIEEIFPGRPVKSRFWVSRGTFEEKIFCLKIFFCHSWTICETFSVGSLKLISTCQGKNLSGLSEKARFLHDFISLSGEIFVFSWNFLKQLPKRYSTCSWEKFDEKCFVWRNYIYFFQFRISAKKSLAIWQKIFGKIVKTEF